MNQIRRIDRQVIRLLKALDQLDPKQEAEQLGRSLRLGLSLAKYTAKQRRRRYDKTGSDH